MSLPLYNLRRDKRDGQIAIEYKPGHLRAITPSTLDGAVYPVGHEFGKIEGLDGACNSWELIGQVHSVEDTHRALDSANAEIVRLRGLDVGKLERRMWELGLDLAGTQNALHRSTQCRDGQEDCIKRLRSEADTSKAQLEDRERTVNFYAVERCELANKNDALEKQSATDRLRIRQLESFDDQNVLRAVEQQALIDSLQKDLAELRGQNDTLIKIRDGQQANLRNYTQRLEDLRSQNTTLERRLRIAEQLQRPYAVGELDGTDEEAADALVRETLLAFPLIAYNIPTHLYKMFLAGAKYARNQKHHQKGWRYLRQGEVTQPGDEFKFGWLTGVPDWNGHKAITNCFRRRA